MSFPGFPATELGLFPNWVYNFRGSFDGPLQWARELGNSTHVSADPFPASELDPSCKLLCAAADRMYRTDRAIRAGRRFDMVVAVGSFSRTMARALEHLWSLVITSSEC
jgi:hypothetical protein